MPEPDDSELLVRYARDNSEEAFAALVKRHVNLVYSVALRRTGNVHAAEEITQAVFIILAKKARGLSGRTILAGWLHQTARLTAANHLRTEIRRQRREQEAHMQSILNEPEPDVWPQIAPLLDDAIAGLGEKDRNAVVLRFFENKSLVEVGTKLGSSEDAAKMRVNRALGKLRKFFTKRGVTLSAGVIASAVAANSVQAAPVGLMISAVAAAKGSAAAASTLTLAKGALKIMAWTKAKTAVVVGVGMLLAAGTATVTVKEIEKYHAPTPIAANSSRRQINVRATFIEVPAPIAAAFAQQVFQATASSNSISSAMLTESEAGALLAKLKAQSGVNVLAAPSVTTLSGRQARIEMVNMMGVATGIKPQALKSPGVADDSAIYQTETNAFGPVLDIVPRLTADGWTIDMTVIATANEFLGYAEPDPTNSATVYVNGGGKTVLPPSPQIRVRRMAGHFQIADGQTVILGHPLDAQGNPAETPGATSKFLFVLITPTIIDAVGNRVQSSQLMFQ